MKNVWDIVDGELVKVAGPINNDQINQLLNDRYNGELVNIIYGGQAQGCTTADNVMVIPTDIDPRDLG